MRLHARPGAQYDGDMPESDGFNVEIDLHDLEQAAQDMGAAVDQVPFAAAKLLNYGVRMARLAMIEQTWPQHVTQRNASFLRGAAFGYGAIKWARKGDLTVEMTDISGRANLAAHAEGGEIKPLRRRTLAIPVSSWVKRGPHGVVQGMTPTDLRSQKDVRTTAKGIFEAQGGRLHLRYSFHTAAKQPADVPFYDTWEQVMATTVSELFEDVMRAAMRTRKAR
jgi:hypothetical protein